MNCALTSFSSSTGNGLRAGRLVGQAHQAGLHHFVLSLVPSVCAQGTSSLRTEAAETALNKLQNSARERERRSDGRQALRVAFRGRADDTW